MQEVCQKSCSTQNAAQLVHEPHLGSLPFSPYSTLRLFANLQYLQQPCLFDRLVARFDRELAKPRPHDSSRLCENKETDEIASERTTQVRQNFYRYDSRRDIWHPAQEANEQCLK